MSDIFATAGSKLYIGQALPASTEDFIVDDFNAQSWVRIGFCETIGAFGDEATIVTFDSIDTGRTYKLKGNRNAGDMSVVCAINPADPGQIAARAAERTPNNYAFRVEFNDMPTGGSTPSYRYFIGLVSSAREQLDGANNVMKLNIAVGINSNIAAVNAA